MRVCKHLEPKEHRCTYLYGGALISKGVCATCPLMKETLGTKIRRLVRRIFS